VPAKIPRIAVYLSEELKQDLEELARVERRSMSQMAAMLIEEGLKRAKEEGKIK
jgi:predicted transcriptional regulator